MPDATHNTFSSSQMRVLIISTMEGSPWGGSEELWSSVASTLLSRGCQVSLSLKAWPNEHPAVSALRAQGADIHYRGGKTLLLKLLGKIADKLRSPLSSFLKKNDPQLVMISQGSNTCGMFWMEACLQLGIRYVPIAQAAVPWFWPSDEHASKLRKAYLGAEMSCFVSKENLLLTQQQIGTVLRNGRVVRNPFKVPYDSSPGWPGDDIARWACVARFEIYIKGLDLLTEVMSWQKWRERPLKVTLYGSGPNADWIKETIARRALENVEIGGFLADPTEIWHRNHCLILPSRAEGLPLAIVEAMLCGRPCIVTDVSGNSELLKNDVTGFIASSATAAALDIAMEAAWQRRQRWRDMGNSAGVSIRMEVPPDPAKAFVNEVLGVPPLERLQEPPMRACQAKTA